MLGHKYNLLCQLQHFLTFLPLFEIYIPLYSTFHFSKLTIKKIFSREQTRTSANNFNVLAVSSERFSTHDSRYFRQPIADLIYHFQLFTRLRTFVYPSSGLHYLTLKSHLRTFAPSHLRLFPLLCIFFNTFNFQFTIFNFQLFTPCQALNSQLTTNDILVSLWITCPPMADSIYSITITHCYLI